MQGLVLGEVNRGGGLLRVQNVLHANIMGFEELLRGCTICGEASPSLGGCGKRRRGGAPGVGWGRAVGSLT